jgi:hypothetical protein
LELGGVTDVVAEPEVEKRRGCDKEGGEEFPRPGAGW